jgi:hypothetical protein
MRYHQVMDNLARIATDPGALPYFGVIEAGTTQISDSGSLTGSLGWDPHGLVSEMLGASGSRNINDQWTLDPIVNPDRLRAMRCVYHEALGLEDANCSDCLKLISDFKVTDELAKVPNGWLGVGCKKDVPKGACYVSHCGDRYVWVQPGGLDGLTRLTWIIMDIATIDLSSVYPTMTETTVKFGSLGRIKVITRTVPDEEEKAAPASGKRRKERSIIVPGLIAPPTQSPR